MGTHLLLWTLGIGIAAFFTAAAARLLDQKRSTWPLLRRLVLASLAMPTIYLGCLLAIAAFLAATNKRDRAGLLHRFPAYLREVLLMPALKLWICGAICAAILGYFSGPPGERQLTSRGGRVLLVLISVIALSAIMVPSGLEYWVRTGHMANVFVLFFMAFAFRAGGLPLAIMQMVSLRRHGLDGLRQMRTFTPGFGVLVAAGGFIWHGSIATRPGAWASWLLTASALAGVLVAWLNGQRALRAGEERLQQLRARKQPADQ
jgi:hypothetical protein